MTEWIVQNYEDGTIGAGERALPDPKIPQYEFDSAQDLIDFCDAKILEIENEWNISPDKDGKDAVKYPIDESLPGSIKREYETWNFEVGEHEKRIEHWQSLKDSIV